MPNHEIEVKLQLENLDRFYSSGIVIEIEKSRHFEDNWLFDTPDLKLQARLAILRVRVVDGQGALTYKEPPTEGAATSQFKKRVEIETVINSPEQMVALLERLGYQKWFRYQKYRTIYQAALPNGNRLQVMFDETPIGSFVELEGTESDIFYAIALLGIKPRDYILESYFTLQAKNCAMRGVPLEDMVFPTSAV